MKRFFIADDKHNFVAGPFDTRIIAEKYLSKYYTNSILGPCHIEEKEV